MRMIIKVLILLLALSATAQAGVYKCVVDGKTTYQSSKCEVDDTEWGKPSAEEVKAGERAKFLAEEKIRAAKYKKVLEAYNSKVFSSKADIKKGFSVWDGAHHDLERKAKRMMNDPDSFKHVSSHYSDNGDGTLNVTMKYRAKNGFGAMRLGSIQAQTSVATGLVLRIIR